MPRCQQNTKKTGNWGPGPWYSEITPKLGNRGIPKLLRNHSEITPKLGTVEFRNYSEIEDRGTMELLRNYSEITPKLGNRGIPKLLRN